MYTYFLAVIFFLGLFELLEIIFQLKALINFWILFPLILYYILAYIQLK